MTDGEAFLDALRTRPADEMARRVYADWLEEQGDADSAAKAAYLRVECQLTQTPPAEARRARKLRGLRRRLAARLDAGWLAVVSKPDVENCGVRFEFQCPKKWENLLPTADEAVRFCDACQRGVHYCKTIDEAQAHAWQGDCVAVSLQAKRSPGDLNLPVMTLGMLRRDPIPPSDQAEQRERPADQFWGQRDRRRGARRRGE